MFLTFIQKQNQLNLWSKYTLPPAFTWKLTDVYGGWGLFLSRINLWKSLKMWRSCCGEHPNLLYHRHALQQLLWSGQEGSAVGDQAGPEDSRDWPPPSCRPSMTEGSADRQVVRSKTTHPLVRLLESGRRYRSMGARTSSTSRALDSSRTATFDRSYLGPYLTHSVKLFHCTHTLLYTLDFLSSTHATLGQWLILELQHFLSL